jgi:hypothetical protein
MVVNDIYQVVLVNSEFSSHWLSIYVDTHSSIGCSKSTLIEYLVVGI